MNLQLIPGQFYLSKDNHIWCCYNVKPEEAQHCQAYCVRLSDSRLGYFFLDGRYDPQGLKGHCLLKKVSFSDYNDCSDNCNCYTNQIEC